MNQPTEKGAISDMKNSITINQIGNFLESQQLKLIGKKGKKGREKKRKKKQEKKYKEKKHYSENQTIHNIKFPQNVISEIGLQTTGEKWQINKTIPSKKRNRKIPPN